MSDSDARFAVVQRCTERALKLNKPCYFVNFACWYVVKVGVIWSMYRGVRYAD